MLKSFKLKGIQTINENNILINLKEDQLFVALIPVFSDGFSRLIFNLSKKQSSAKFSALPIISHYL